MTIGFEGLRAGGDPVGRRSPFSGGVAAVADEARRRPILTVAVLTALVSALALAFPHWDRDVAALFFHPGEGFTAARSEPLLLLRAAGRWVWVAAIGLAAGVAAVAVVRSRRARIPTMRRATFLVASLALGPGLIVNLMLKEGWGRPRPRDVLDFGGDLAFVPAWIPGGGCPTNCSFPSGEASSAMWLVAFVFVVPKAWRPAVLAASLAAAVAVSANRMAFGGHFLSDVAIGWGLVVLVVLVCREIFLRRRRPRMRAGG